MLKFSKRETAHHEAGQLTEAACCPITATTLGQRIRFFRTPRHCSSIRANR
jgi:hypothetical protein